MTREDIIRMAQEAGFYKDQPMYYDESMLERFAALVIANHPPQSSMAWQEGYEAGKQTEREACAKLVDYWESRQGEHSDAIRARGDKHD